jgi:hypothetical protein
MKDMFGRKVSIRRTYCFCGAIILIMPNIVLEAWHRLRMWNGIAASFLDEC